MLVGDLKAQSLEEIWNAEKMNFYREMLVNMRHEELELCRNCYDYLGLETPGIQNVV